MQDIIEMIQKFGKNTTIQLEHKISLTSQDITLLTPIIDQIDFSSLEVIVDGSSTEALSSFKVKTRSLKVCHSSTDSNHNEKNFLPQARSNICETLELFNIRDFYWNQSFTTLNLLPNLLYLKKLVLENCKISISQQYGETDHVKFYMPSLKSVTLKNCVFRLKPFQGPLTRSF